MGVFQFNILWRWLDSDEVTQKKKSAESCLVFFSLFACWVPQQLHSYSLQLPDKGCHRVRLPVSNTAQAAG